MHWFFIGMMAGRSSEGSNGYSAPETAADILADHVCGGVILAIVALWVVYMLSLWIRCQFFGKSAPAWWPR